jgi:NAD-dependent DNA ligase
MIKELVEKITRASQEYYEFGESFLSDSEFDKELETLRKLDPENPILSEVGHGYILKGIDDKEKFEHPIEVGSIEKTKELSRLREFLNPSSTFSTKIDGNSVVCYYKNGNLFKVVTRGTKNIGIDRTAKFISIVPNKIPLVTTLKRFPFL